jgi:hypothetical protein
MIDTELGSAPQELQGFAFEGAAMGFALLDLVMPWRGRRFARFITGPAAAHIYMAHVGAGWALARTSPYLAWRLGSFDPLLQWLATDGYGFTPGIFIMARRSISGIAHGDFAAMRQTPSIRDWDGRSGS